MTSNSNKVELVITRTFNAPRDLVWKAYTEESRLKQWWGPKGFIMLAAKLDLKPGGTFHFGMRGPDGSEFWAKFIYREITAQTNLSFTNGFSDATGADAPNPWMKIWPREILNSFTFDEQDGKTIMTLRVFPINCSEEEYHAFAGMQSSMQGGYNGTFDNLDAHLANYRK